jgi:hypothetical protein
MSVMSPIRDLHSRARFCEAGSDSWQWRSNTTDITDVNGCGHQRAWRTKGPVRRLLGATADTAGGTGWSLARHGLRDLHSRVRFVVVRLVMEGKGDTPRGTRPSGVTS